MGSSRISESGVESPEGTYPSGEVYCQPQTVAFNVKSVQRRPCLKATSDW